MGWMQRHTKWLFLFGITFMILSSFAFVLSANLGSGAVPEPVPTATPTPTEEPDPNATPTPEPIQRTYSAPPEMSIDPDATYRAVIQLESGEVVVELLADEAPEYVNNFVFLAQNRFFEGLTFHRVIPGFVAQAGDPLGSGTGGPGYVLPEETTDRTFSRGSLSMAKSAAGVSGSQFFITLGATPHLNADFTVFGRVVEGLELLDALTPRDPSAGSPPPGDTILSIEIVEE